ncbi:hypothetical protein [Lysobacter gummosus]|uniref:hypothetical protein n=1 Tax=Lysobacter gummosus TaxID=262324 RepID=UPI0036423B44
MADFQIEAHGLRNLRPPPVGPAPAARYRPNRNARRSRSVAAAAHAASTQTIGATPAPAWVLSNSLGTRNPPSSCPDGW